MDQLTIQNIDLDAFSQMNDEQLRSHESERLKAAYFSIKHYLVAAEERHSALSAELAAIEKVQDDLCLQLIKIEGVFRPALTRLELGRVTDRNANVPTQGKGARS